MPIDVAGASPEESVAVATNVYVRPVKAAPGWVQSAREEAAAALPGARGPRGAIRALRRHRGDQHRRRRHDRSFGQAHATRAADARACDRPGADVRARGRSRAGDAGGGPETSGRGRCASSAETSRRRTRARRDRREAGGGRREAGGRRREAGGGRRGAGGGRREAGGGRREAGGVAEKPRAARPPPETAPPTGDCTARVVTEPKDAKVIWAGTVIGRSPIDGARVPCGPATVTIERERWQPVTVDVNAQAGVAGQGPRAAAAAARHAGRQLDAAGRADQRQPRRRGRRAEADRRPALRAGADPATLKGYQPWNKTLYLKEADAKLDIQLVAAQVAARGCHDPSFATRGRSR